MTISNYHSVDKRVAYQVRGDSQIDFGQGDMKVGRQRVEGWIVDICRKWGEEGGQGCYGDYEASLTSAEDGERRLW